ncbi:hypothetical protein GGF46_003775 [Coemansia sp. RSA 552]|nr:hypothetical protein GGF46_003775 [Coemansia sp. RSA 552]
MGSFRESLTDADRAWIEQQKVYFVATAPLSGSGRVNASPKGYDSLRVADANRIILLDGRGSGCETIAHVRENGRITIMMCAFEGAPRIMRLLGHASVYEPGSPQFDELFEEYFAAHWRDPARFKFVRSIIDVHVDLVGQSCGFAVPLMDYQSDRQTLVKYQAGKSDAELAKRRAEYNTTSIDGIPSYLNGTDSGMGSAALRLARRALPWAGAAAFGAAVALAVARPR